MLHVPIGTNTYGVTYSPQSATRPAAAQGTAITPTTGSKSGWVQLTASTGSFDSYGILINFNSNSASNASRNTMADIGIGAAGSEIVVIENLICAGASTYVVGFNQWYFFPLLIPAGSRLAIRAQSSVTTAFRCYIQCLQAPLNPSAIRKGSFVETIGAGTVPGGTAVTAGTTAEGAWTLLGTTTSRLWWWQLGIQIATSDTSWIAGAQHFDVAYGDATNKQIIIQDLLYATTTAEVGSNPPLTAGVECPVPEDTNIYVRAQSSGAPDPYLVTAYGLGG
jgi:hypothetical protein